MIKTQKFKEASFLALLTLLCFSLSIIRHYYTDSRVFLFLNWNLFLAGIPWLLSTIALLLPKLQKSALAISLLLMIWLLFFPNAPYILTDLFHLRLRGNAPIWYDLVLILSFAWTGLLFGFLSLRDIERLLAPKLNVYWLAISSISLLFLTSFGIYLGRFLRWNSWDILESPTAILHDIGVRCMYPLEHPTTWGMTILMWILLNMMYWSFRFMSVEKQGVS